MRPKSFWKVAPFALGLFPSTAASQGTGFLGLTNREPYSAVGAETTAAVAPPPVKPASQQGLVHGLSPDDDPLARGGRGDGVYGRFDGDFSLSLGAGAQADFSVEQVLAQAYLAFRVYQLAGVYHTYAQGFSGGTLERTVSAGLLLEPLFLFRWSNDMQSGHPFWDLTLDSLSLSVGAHWDEPVEGRFGDASGVEAGLGFGVPLLGDANGPWIRARGLLLSRPNGAAAAAWLRLEWQWFFFTGVLEDEPAGLE